MIWPFTYFARRQAEAFTKHRRAELRWVAPQSAWEWDISGNEKMCLGFVRLPKQSTVFLWSPTYGLDDQYGAAGKWGLNMPTLTREVAFAAKSVTRDVPFADIERTLRKWTPEDFAGVAKEPHINVGCLARAFQIARANPELRIVGVALSYGVARWQHAMLLKEEPSGRGISEDGENFFRGTSFNQSLPTLIEAYWHSVHHYRPTVRNCEVYL